MTSGFIFLLCLLSSINTRELPFREFVVWNIGQGQWTTLIESDTCSHFDVGGEYNISSHVAQACATKLNVVHLSHWDWDHIGLLKKFAPKVPRLCLFERPYGPHSANKEHLLDQIPLCKTDLGEAIKIYDGAHLDNEKKSNENCRVYFLKKFHILIPGDSTKSEEKKWATSTDRYQVQGLVLGHHGSQTSTSQVLLDHLPHLKWAVSTARYVKYGHPHPTVVARLKQNHIPLLKTEDWGNLHFIL